MLTGSQLCMQTELNKIVKNSEKSQVFLYEKSKRVLKGL